MSLSQQRAAAADTSAENLLASSRESLADDDDDEEEEATAALHGDGPVPCSPPPSYQRVLEECRLERQQRQRQQSLGKRASFDARPTTTRPSLARRAHTLADDRPDPERLLSNKSSKEMYAAMVKELGLSCRMSEHCRCADCQGGYLKCAEDDEERDDDERAPGVDNDNETDGGLGAGTPMFVLGHGTAPACSIL